MELLNIDHPGQDKSEQQLDLSPDELLVGYLNSGEYFGELSLVQCLPKTVGAVCSQNTHLLYLEASDL